jgi:hypothetical protein
MKYIHPSDNKDKKGMRVYGVYKLDDYPDWNILVIDFGEYSSGTKTMKGLAFFKKNGTLDCMVETDFTLHLEYKKTINKSSCSDCDPIFMPMCDKCLGV